MDDEETDAHRSCASAARLDAMPLQGNVLCHLCGISGHHLEPKYQKSVILIACKIFKVWGDFLGKENTSELK